MNGSRNVEKALGISHSLLYALTDRENVPEPTGFSAVLLVPQAFVESSGCKLDWPLRASKPTVVFLAVFTSRNAGSYRLRILGIHGYAFGLEGGLTTATKQRSGELPLRVHPHDRSGLRLL